VLAVVAHWYLRQRVDRKLAVLEMATSELVDRLGEDA
jgi:hypothetical protein